MKRITVFSPLPVVTLAFAIAVAGCQSVGRMSIEEARETAAGFKGRTFTPPPRTTNDIIGLLESQKPNPYWLKNKSAMADEELPSYINEEDRWRFYWRRAHPRQLLGRLKESMEDYRTSYELSHHIPIRPDRRGMMRASALTELEMGNFRQAIEVIERAIQLQGGRSVGSESVAAQIYAAIGDTGKTVRYARRVVRSLDKHGADRYDPPAEFQDPTLRYLIAEAEGDWLAAEFYIRRSIEIYRNTSRKGAYPNWLERRQFVLAENLIHQDRYVEAEAVTREALISLLTKAGKYNLDVVKALMLFSKALMFESRFDEAAELSRVALEILSVIGVPKRSPYWGQVHYVLGKTLAGVGDWPGAVAAYEVVRTGLEEGSYFYKKYFADDLEVALAYARAGRIDQALRLIEPIAAARRETFGEKSDEMADVEAALGVAYFSGGDHMRARRHFEQALSHFVSAAGGAPKGRNIFLQQAAEGFLQAVSSNTVAGGGHIDPALVPIAFVAAQIVRGGELRKAISASAARTAISDPELKKLVRQLQDSEQQLKAMEGYLVNMLAAPASARTDGGIAGFNQQVAKLRQAVLSIRADIDKRFPDYAQLVEPRPVSLATAQAMLPAETAVAAFFTGSEQSYVFVVTRNRLAQGAVIPLSTKTLSDKVTQLRAAVDPGKLHTLNDIPDFDVGLANELYRALLEPVKESWWEAKDLLIVAHGPLGQLPFSLLTTSPVAQPEDTNMLFDWYRDVPWLARTHAVTVMPSVTSLKTQDRIRVARTNKRPLVGFGDPYFSEIQAEEALSAQSVQVASRGISLRSVPRTRSVDSADLAMLPRLPDTRDELLAIATSMGADPAKDLYLGKRASEQMVKSTDLSGYSVISFATHGLVPGDLNGLDQPALALSSPKVTGDMDDDGLLTMGEILGLRLNADWVVLSACNTAAGDGRGAEAVSGLGRAFFYAGTSAILVSNWPVHSTATTELMTTLFRYQTRNPDIGRAEALKVTRLKMIDEGVFKDVRGRAVFSYAHPIFWAPFTIVGNGS